MRNKLIGLGLSLIIAAGILVDYGAIFTGLAFIFVGFIISFCSYLTKE